MTTELTPTITDDEVTGESIIAVREDMLEESDSDDATGAGDSPA